MPNLRIVIAKDGYSILDANFNPNVVPDGDSDDNPFNDTLFNEGQMEEEIVAYWGITQVEKMFPVPYWKAEQLMGQSNLKQLAFKVTNIEDPSIAEGEWVSFNAATTVADNLNTGNQALKDAAGKIITIISNLVSSDSESYFVLNQELYSRLRDGVIEQGNISLQTINARIGKTTTGVFVLYFILGGIQLHLAGTGGEGPACGARIPPRL